MLPIANLVFISLFVGGTVGAAGKVYSGFGAQMPEAQPVLLENNHSTPGITMTAYQVSPERAEAFNVIDEQASVKFQLIGLPAGFRPADYRVTWKFDDQHRGVDEQQLRPFQTSNIHIRYNTNVSSHRMIELTVTSVDGHWIGSTSFPISGASNPSLQVTDGNVLLIPMKAIN